MDSPFILGFVSTAVNKHAVRDGLSTALGVGSADVDKTLCALTATAEALVSLGKVAAGLAQPTPRMIDITIKLPRTSVLKLWEQALEEAMTVLASKEEATRVLLVGNMYHSPRRSEYFSPFDIECFRRSAVKHRMQLSQVVMFIDDIYDMFGRLAGPDEVFAPLKTLSTEANRVVALDKIALGKLPLAEQALIATEVQVAQLVQLLHWRQLEVTQAERVARTLQVPYLLWAVKQDVSALKPWLTNTGRGVTYVSHPISRPRRTEASTHVWPAIVSECNSLQSALAKLGFTAVMPTAIDEFRIAKGERPGDASRRLHRLPLLTPRWPLIDSGPTLYLAPDGSAPDHLDLLKPHRLVIEDGVDDRVEDVSLRPHERILLDAPLRFLEVQIEAQVSARDHTIVASTKHTIVFRPFFEESELSRGVRAEIEHWQDLAVDEPPRRIAFLHRIQDAEEVLNGLKIEDEIRRMNLERIEASENVVRDRAEELLADMTRSSQSYNMLAKQEQAPNEEAAARARIESLVLDAPRQLLWRELAQYGVQIRPDSIPMERVGVWIVDSNTAWETVLPGVCDFLAGAAPVPMSAFQRGLDLLGSLKSAQQGANAKKMKSSFGSTKKSPKKKKLKKQSAAKK